MLGTGMVMGHYLEGVLHVPHCGVCREQCGERQEVGLERARAHLLQQPQRVGPLPRSLARVYQDVVRVHVGLRAARPPHALQDLQSPWEIPCLRAYVDKGVVHHSVPLHPARLHPLCDTHRGVAALVAALGAGRQDGRVGDLVRGDAHCIQGIEDLFCPFPLLARPAGLRHRVNDVDVGLVFRPEGLQPLEDLQGGAPLLGSPHRPDHLDVHKVVGRDPPQRHPLEHLQPLFP
mmetsp:Transcript_22574/g.70054  ORF Transcript_22574/g.70054 Transcript_22574/m.70054 type:complete len:233 (-) Transcript_22574:270-968(-)